MIEPSQPAITGSEGSLLSELPVNMNRIEKRTAVVSNLKL